MSEETLDIRRVLGLLRRRVSIVAVCVLVGALIPTVWTLWHPAPYSAKSLVLVPSSASTGSSGTVQRISLGRYQHHGQRDRCEF